MAGACFGLTPQDGGGARTRRRRRRLTNSLAQPPIHPLALSPSPCLQHRPGVCHHPRRGAARRQAHPHARPHRRARRPRRLVHQVGRRWRLAPAGTVAAAAAAAAAALAAAAAAARALGRSRAGPLLSCTVPFPTHAQSSFNACRFVQELEEVLAEACSKGCDAKIASGGGRMGVTMDR